MSEFVAGLIVGSLAGILLGPILRSWIIWREVGSVRRDASLADGILARMDRSAGELDRWPPDDPSDGAS